MYQYICIFKLRKYSEFSVEDKTHNRTLHTSAQISSLYLQCLHGEDRQFSISTFPEISLHRLPFHIDTNTLGTTSKQI